VPQHTVGDTVVIHRDPFAYISHPSITVLPNGDWVAVFNHSRRRTKNAHPPEDPLYRCLLARSRDRGRTWDEPWFAPDFGWHGCECPAIGCVGDGTVVLTQYRYRWLPIGLAKKRHAEGERLAIWLSMPNWTCDFDDADWDRVIRPWARGVDGLYAHFSRDGAETFEETVEIDCSPYHPGYTRTPIRDLADGRLGYALYEPHREPDGKTYFLASSDRGRTWSPLALIYGRTDDKFSEPDFIELDPGELLCALRSTSRHRLFTSRSTDGGATWSEPEPTPIDGLPGHLVKLSDGRLLCSYGRRKDPFGIRMMLSENGGRNWQDKAEIVVRDDLRNGNLGYPTAIEYEAGRLFVAYYGEDPDGITCVQGTYVDLE
jgi:hypothetical protein